MEYFSEPAPEEYEALKKSIALEGVRDPLKVTPDYTVVAGHVRLEIAKELGLEKVPVQIIDGDPKYLEYLLIADNEERRVCQNPIKKAKRAEFLKRYWGVRQGSANPKGTAVPRQVENLPDDKKTLSNVAEAIGESLFSTKQLLKLNDLIPFLQELVSQGKFSQTAAHSLAFLPPEEQKQLLEALGESGVCGLSVKEAQELRRQVEAARKERDALAEKLAEAQERERNTERRIASIRQQVEDIEAEIAEKVGRQYEEKMREKLAELQRQTVSLKTEKDEAQRSITSLKAKIKELESAPPKVVEKVVEKVPEDYQRIKKDLEVKSNELLALTRSQLLQKDRYKIHDMFSDLVQALGKHMKRIELEISKHPGDPDIYKDATECATLLEKSAGEIRRWVSPRGGVVIEADFTTRSV
jgi:ParB family chromosome partitioning protein